MSLRRALLPLSAALCVGPVAGQSFSDNTTDIPTGAPHNASYTENVDFGDIDGDGDLDAIFADGGDNGNDRNRLWLNKGNAQGGPMGLFVDRTTQRMPAVQDDSRDVEFVDIDGDGDLDIYSSNTSSLSNQSNRWIINVGGLQGGTEGWFVDESATRWVNLGVNNGTTICSSVSPSLVIPGSGFVDWSCDCDFGDLDNDGDLDLVHSTYGGVFGGQTPTRLFLNDGAGHFEEFNPSCFQLVGQDVVAGSPGLWCEGVQTSNTTVSNGTECDIATTAIDIDVGDHDGDLDLDILHGARNEPVRMFAGRLEENGGTLGFRDVTGAVFPPGYAVAGNHYEQEWGDLDNDGDLDIYGVNWKSGATALDTTLVNDGTGVYGNQVVLTGSDDDDNEVDFLDYDQDGDLDAFVANFEGTSRLLRNDLVGGVFSFTDVSGAELPAVLPESLDADAADTDLDGDTDLFVARDQNKANLYLQNITEVPDTSAPWIPLLEQAPDRTASSAPTVIRAHVYDNAPYYVTWYAPTTLEYTVDGGVLRTAPMLSSGGQVFRAELPGALTGVIAYSVRAVDLAGNAGVSAALSYTAGGTCGGNTTNYCSAGTTASGCQASLSATGVPSLSAPSGFAVAAAGVEGQKDGVFFYGFNGAQANGWGNGSSLQCVVPPVKRVGGMSGVGTAGACDGAFSVDLNTFWSSANPSKVPAPGQEVSLQLWFRDPLNTSNQTTSFSDALQFTACP
jgi:hypothetical protein